MPFIPDDELKSGFQPEQSSGFVPDAEEQPSLPRRIFSGIRNFIGGSPLFPAPEGTPGKTGSILRTVGNVAPDFAQTLVRAPYDIGKGIYEETKGLINESGGVLPALKNYVGVVTNPSIQEQKRILGGFIPKATKQVFQGDYIGAAKQIQEHPFQEIAPYIGAYEGLKGGLPSSSKMGEAVTQGGSKFIRNTYEGAKSGLKSRYFDQSVKEWQRPAETPKASYNDATEIYKKAKSGGNDIPSTLAKSNIRLENNVAKTGTGMTVYDTADTASVIRGDNAKISSEVLRPSLKVADYNTPKTPVDDIVNATIEDIKKTRGTTPGNNELQIERVKAEGEALKRKYPQGMSLVDMHDNKISYASNGMYSPVGDITVNNSANVNRAFGRTLGSLVEEKAPPDIPVGEFNGELQRQYEVADYLDALHGKGVPRSILQNIARTTSKVVGAAVGHHLGGGVLGGVGGYHIGGMIESIIENTNSPIRGLLLDNLERTNPEAFNTVKNYIGKEETTRLQRKLLQPGNTIYSDSLPSSRGGVGKMLTQDQAAQFLKEHGVSGAGKWRKITVENGNGKKVDIPIQKPLNLGKKNTTVRLRNTGPVHLKIRKLK